MYYILNEANHVIAADDELLSFCGVSRIDELYLAMGLNKIKFIPAPENRLKIDNNGSESDFPSSQTSLSSMLGHLTLINLAKEESTTKTVQKEPKIDTIETEDPFDSINLFDDEPTTTVSSSKKIKETPIEKETVTLDLFDDITEENTTTISEPVQETIELEDLNTDNIILDIVDEVKIPEIEEKSTPIFVNINEVSEKIGVSTDDYKAFFTEYLDTAQSVKTDLEGSDIAKRSTAITTLSHLGYMLYLPEVGDILTHIGEIEEAQAQKEVAHFYSTVSRIELKSEVAEPTLEEVRANLKRAKKEKNKTEGFGSINLEGVKPIHFDFQLEQAASELSLPVELIEEFVNDFIDQAHTETVKMLAFYEEGNLDAIQKIGHLLKGASSNLRIVPLSDTLYQIQFCEDSNLLEGYILSYWAHFLSFETQIKMISSK